MGTKLTIELSTEQAVGLVAMAAAKSWAVEDEVVYLIEVALAETGYLPAIDLDDLLKEIPKLPAPIGKPAKLRSSD